jgi:hypothetical protein
MGAIKLEKFMPEIESALRELDSGGLLRRRARDLASGKLGPYDSLDGRISWDAFWLVSGRRPGLLDSMQSFCGGRVRDEWISSAMRAGFQRVFGVRRPSEILLEGSAEKVERKCGVCRSNDKCISGSGLER